MSRTPRRAATVMLTLVVDYGIKARRHGAIGIAGGAEPG